MPKIQLPSILIDLFHRNGRLEVDIVEIVKDGYDREFISYSFILHFFFYFLLLLPPFFLIAPNVLPFLMGITFARLTLLLQNYKKSDNFRYVIYMSGFVADGFFYASIAFTVAHLPTVENFYLSNAYLMVCSILILLNSIRLDRFSCLIAASYFIFFHIVYQHFMPSILIEQTSLFSRSFPILTFIGAGFLGSAFTMNKRKSIVALYKLSEERRFIQQELELAKRVQDALFPKDTKIPGLKFKYYRSNPNLIGGDFFDFVQLREGNVGVFLADVAGHGISSAMVASIMKVMVSTIPYRLKLSPAKLLDYMDERLYFDLNKYHASAVYLYFDFFSNFMRIANAGHPYMIHCPKNKEFYEIETEGAILGFNIRTPIATEQVVSFAPGDRFVIYTDGIIESVTASNEELGSVGFLEILNAHTSLTQLEDLQESILSDLRTRHGIQTFSDDTMFLLLEVDEYMEKSN